MCLCIGGGQETLAFSMCGCTMPVMNATEDLGETSPFDGIRSFANIPLDEILDILHDSHERSLSN